MLVSLQCLVNHVWYGNEEYKRCHREKHQPQDRSHLLNICPFQPEEERKRLNAEFQKALQVKSNQPVPENLLLNVGNLLSSVGPYSSEVAINQNQ